MKILSGRCVVNFVLIACLFFLTTANFPQKNFIFDPTLSSNKSGLRNYSIKNHHIFRDGRTSAFIWHPWIPLKKFCNREKSICVCEVLVHYGPLTLYYWTFQVTTMSLVIPYIINMYRFGVLDQLGQLIILIYHICIFGVWDLLEINVVQIKKFILRVGG